MARIRERRPGVWEITVWTPIDPVSGRRGQVSRTVHGGRRLAEGHAAKLTVEVEAGKHKDRHSLNELLDDYLRHQEARGWAPKTLLESRRIAREVKEALGAKDIAKLTALDFDEFYARLAARGLSTTTRHHYHSLIRASLNQAIRWGWLPPPNPAGAAEAPPLRPEEREPPTPAEARRLAVAVFEAHPDLATLIFVAAATGMRRGELCGLRWCDVDLETGQATVNQRVSDLPGGIKILPGTKTKKRRPLALGPFTVAVLAEQRARAVGRCEALGVALAAGAYIWSQDADHGSPWRPNRVTDAFAAVRRAEGLDNIRFQDLRHFSATQMLGAGVDARTAAGRLGHDPSVLLRIYGHVIPANDREAAAILGQLMSREQN